MRNFRFSAVFINVENGAAPGIAGLTPPWVSDRLDINASGR